MYFEKDIATVISMTSEMGLNKPYFSMVHLMRIFHTNMLHLDAVLQAIRTLIGIFVILEMQFSNIRNEF